MRFTPTPCCPAEFSRWLICQHQVEIEIWPASAEVYFLDERFCDPANTQVRFEAAVCNAPDAQVLWAVRAADGGAGRGSIDSTGLYTAPVKNGLPSPCMEIVTASAKADPLRRAYAQVTLIGKGPPDPPPITLLLLPKRSCLYYRNGVNTGFIDASNKQQVFRALLTNAAPPLTWAINGPGTLVASNTDLCLYQAPDSGNDGEEVIITVTLQTDVTVHDQAEIALVNYSWSGIVP